MPQSAGWRYEQPLPQGGFQRIPARGCAGTDGELVRQVRFFRINTGIDVGNPEFDVAEFIKRESPLNNRFPNRTTKASEEAAKPQFRPLIERVKDFLVSVGRKNPRLMIEDEADERSMVCADCPQNVKWQTGCEPCNDAVRSRGQNLRQLPHYKHDKDLRACRLHDLFLPTAVFLDRENLPAVNPDAPQACWMRKIT